MFTQQAYLEHEFAEMVCEEAEIEGVVDTKIVPDEGGDSITYRLTVFYGRPTGGRLEAGGDAEAAEWVHLDNVEAFPMTPGTVDLIWVAAHRARMP